MAANKKVSDRKRAAQAEQQKKAQERDHRLQVERERHAQAERDRIAKAAPREERISLAKKIVGGLITLVGLYASIVGLLVSFQTRISISSDSAIDPSNIFSAPFTVSNDGYLDLHNVSSRWIAIKVLGPASGFTLESKGPYTGELGGMQYPSMAIDLLPATGKHTFTCPFPFKDVSVSSADIVISVTYRPSWWPFTYQVHKRFMTARGDNKPQKWYEEPTPK